jgi:hypothetical protein
MAVENGGRQKEFSGTRILQSKVDFPHVGGYPNKAWEVTFDEWNQQGEATFSAFMKRNQGPESKYGGGKINYTASRIMGVRNDN